MVPKPTKSACHPETSQPFPVEAALKEAETQCAELGLRLTPRRREVLELLLRADRALSAYEILDRMQAGDGRVMPPIAYRALDFLTEHGLAHKIGHMKAYVPCIHPGENHTPAFLVCSSCRSVTESEVVRPQNDLASAAKAVGFRIERTLIEAEGVCRTCAAETHA